MNEWGNKMRVLSFLTRIKCDALVSKGIGVKENIYLNDRLLQRERTFFYVDMDFVLILKT